MECPICGAPIVKVGLYKADIEFNLSEDGKLTIARIEPRTQYHVRITCTEGHSGEDSGGYFKADEEMKIWYNELPGKIIEQIQEMKIDVL